MEDGQDFLLGIEKKLKDGHKKTPKSLVLKGTINNSRAFLSLAFFYHGLRG